KNQRQVETSENRSNGGDEFNDAEDSDREISILRTVNAYTNLDNIDSDNDSEIIEDRFEVETAEGHSIISSKKLSDTIKELENEIKSNKHSEWLKTFGFEYLEVRKEMYMDDHKCADVVAYHKRFLERMAVYETQMIIFSGENMKEEI
ncbi:10414_t:CDS:2, partial [Racocetra fulgida]